MVRNTKVFEVSCTGSANVAHFTEESTLVVKKTVLTTVVNVLTVACNRKKVTNEGP